MHPTFDIFGLTLPAFGIMMMLGLVSAFVLMYFLRRHIAITEDDFLSAAIWAILCGMLGSKLLFPLMNLFHRIRKRKFRKLLPRQNYACQLLCSGAFVLRNRIIQLR